MKIYFDSSFLASLYIQDSNSFEAISLIKKLRVGVIFTQLQHFELLNTLRLCVFRKQVSQDVSGKAEAMVRDDIKNGFFVETVVPWFSIFSDAIKISERLTGETGCRAADMLHIAIAGHLKCSHLWSFDQRQNVAAKAAGLEILKLETKG